MTRKRKKALDDIIKVTLLPLGGEAKEIILKKGDTAGDALKAGGLNFGRGTEVRVNGEILDKDMEVEDGESLIISSAGKIEGGK